MALSLLEIMGYSWVLVASWSTTQQCYYSYSYYSYSNYTCYTFWIGWVYMVIWWVFAIAFGIPRIILTMNFDVGQPASGTTTQFVVQQSPAPVSLISPV